MHDHLFGSRHGFERSPSSTVLYIYIIDAAGLSGCWRQEIAEKEGIGAFLADRDPNLAIVCVRAMAEAAAVGQPINHNPRRFGPSVLRIVHILTGTGGMHRRSHIP